MKQIICIIFFFFLLFLSQLNIIAQPSVAHTWSKALNNNQPFGSTIEGQCIVSDAVGNIYITGSFHGTFDFDHGAGIANLTSAGYSDIFIAKYDALGNYVFARAIGGNSSDFGTSLAVDGSGNIFISGHFQSIVDFDPGAGVANLTSAGSTDIFFAKYNASGNYVYAQVMGAASSDFGSSLAVDGSGNVYLTGYFSGTADFDPGAGVVNLTSVGSYDIFFAKYNASGAYIYARAIGGSGWDFGTSLVVDVSGNIYITGQFQGSSDFDPSAGVVNLTSVGDNDIFFAKYNASGAYIYARAIGSTGDDRSNSLAMDGSGNVYITGYFYNTVDFDPGAGVVNLTSAGSVGSVSNRDIFIAKYDALGNYVYARNMGGSATDIGNSLAVDGSGNVYVTGYFFNTADFDPGTGVVNLGSAGSNDVFFAKYDASGNYVYAWSMGGPSSDFGADLAVDGSGNVYITGYFGGTADFNPSFGVANLTSAGGFNMFVASYNHLGNYRYAGALGGGDINGLRDVSTSITRDAAGNVYVSGYFSGTVDFDPGPGVANLTGAGGSDIFFAKYDASGNYVYARNMGGPGFDYGYSMAVDGSGNLYVTGFFQGTTDFDPGPGVANLTSAGGTNIFFAKYDVSGNYVFARAMGGTSSSSASSMMLDGSGNVYLTGYFYGTVDFDPGPGVANLTGAGGSDIFFAKYDASGNYVFARAMGGTSSDYSNSLAVDGSGNVYLTGYFQGTTDFDPSAGVANLTSVGNYDIFFAKYNASGNYVYARRIGSTGVNRGNSLAVDGSGNLYVTGSFKGTADFDPGPGVANLTGAGGSDIFFAKYDASGNYVFARAMGGTSSSSASSMMLDGSGNVYLTGSFQGTTDFDPSAGVANLTSVGDYNIFFAKYNASGNYIFARAMGGTSSSSASSMMLDGSGNVYLTGSFEDIADFDPGAGVASGLSLNNSDIFYAKYSECQLSIPLSGNTAGIAVISGTSIISDGSCNLLASITPNGSSPVTGTVNGMSWIESAVPANNGKPFVARHYEIQPTTNPTTATANITLYFTQAEFDDFNAHSGSTLNLPTGAGDAAGKANLRIGKYAGTSNNGSGLPSTYNGSAVVIDPDDANIVWNTALIRWEVSFNVTGFNGFIVQTETYPLPLTLLTFRGHLQNNNAILNWETENELNTDRFSIERSTNGRNYAAIGFISALNTAGIHNYGFIDSSVSSLSAQVVYYRLQQIDRDGKINYSNVIALSVDGKKNMLMLYPNPVNNKVSLSVSVNKADRVQGRIIDNTGRVIKQQLWNLAVGSTSLSIDVSALAKGIYYLELKGENINERKQFIKQ